MISRELGVLTIGPDPGEEPGVDVRDLLCSVAPWLGGWQWLVKHLDWLGENAEVLCRQVDEAGPRGLWVSSEQLLNYARGVYQTLEGEFLAFPVSLDPRSIGDDELVVSAFPSSPAELAIVAVDGSYFELYAKDRQILEAFGRFKNVRIEDPAVFF